jgi:hypothetical protein
MRALTGRTRLWVDVVTLVALAAALVLGVASEHRTEGPQVRAAFQPGAR